MHRDPLTRGEAAVRWVEEYCVHPDGRAVRLTAQQRALCYVLYDAAQRVPIPPPLSAYLVLFHVCGPAAKDGLPPPVTSDLFTVLSAIGPMLKPHLVRSGDRIVCRALGTTWSAGSVAA